MARGFIVKTVVLTCSDRRLWEKIFSLFETLIKAHMAAFLAVPGSSKRLFDYWSRETIDEMETIAKDWAERIIIVGHSDCKAYKSLPLESQYEDMRRAVKFCNANYREAEVILVWATVDEKENVELFKVRFDEEKVPSFSLLKSIKDI